MKDFVFYIKLERYLAQWLTHSLGNPVRFPAQSNENSVIRRFLQKLPPDKLPEMPSDDTVAIVIPDSKAKDPAVYNYLGPLAKEAVVESIEDLFRRNLWSELGDMTSSSVGLNKTIAAWCEMHGIDIDYIETVRQKYYRMRNAYNRKGMFLGSLTRKREDKTPVFVQHRTIMNEIHYINRVEYCEVRELAAMTVVKKQFVLVPPVANFIRLPMVGLASVEVSNKIENKQRVFVSKLAVFLPERFEVGNKKLCFRLRTVSGEYFMLGSGDRPYSIITSTDTIPDTPSSRCGSAMVVTYTGILPLLRIMD